MTDLFPGDATFAKSFVKVQYSECGTIRRDTRFSPGKKRKFVTLLLGDVDATETHVDVEKMLNDLGFYRNGSEVKP